MSEAAPLTWIIFLRIRAEIAARRVAHGPHVSRVGVLRVLDRLVFRVGWWGELQEGDDDGL